MMEQGEWYTPDELQELPDLAIGQADTCVHDTGTQRLWYGRTEDSPAVSVETLSARFQWETTYEGDPRRVRINWQNEIEVNEAY